MAGDPNHAATAASTLGIASRRRAGSSSAPSQAAGALRGLVDLRLDAVDGPSIATCELRSTGGSGTYTSQTCPFTGAVTGPHRIYLVFSQAPGGPAGGFGLLNWVEFSGAGI